VSDATALLRRLATRRGLSLGGLASGRIDEFRALLVTAALRFAPATAYTEAAVNTALRDWLDGEGAMVATDHVEVRRWLVDTGLLQRDGFGRRYERALPPPAPFAAVLDALAGVDVPALVARARADEAAERAARRARFAAQGDR
jgi:hypothetical protein